MPYYGLPLEAGMSPMGAGLIRLACYIEALCLAVVVAVRAVMWRSWGILALTAAVGLAPALVIERIPFEDIYIRRQLAAHRADVRAPAADFDRGALVDGALLPRPLHMLSYDNRVWLSGGQAAGPAAARRSVLDLADDGAGHDHLADSGA